MKKLFAILLALVICLGVCSFVACEKDDNADVPVAEGKVTIYFEMAEDSVTLPSHTSVFFAGSQTNWATSVAAPEFKKVEGKNLYYIQIEYDEAVEKGTEYALVLGFNKSSGLPDDKCGLMWDNDDYKSDTCKEFAYGTNATFEYKAGAKTISLGTHKFSTARPDPVRIDTELRITFSKALGANAEVYFMGGFNDWTVSKAKATANADRTVYSLALTDVLCSNYEYKILVVRDKTAATTTKTENETTTELGIWDWNETTPTFPAGVTHNETSVIRAYVEIGAADGADLALAIVESDNDSYVDLLETISEDNADRDEHKTGLNLNQIDLVEGKDKQQNPNNVFTWKYQQQLPEKTLVVEFDAAIPATTDLYIMGEFNGWGKTVAGSKMTVAADRKSASYAVEIAPGDYQYNIVAIHKDVRLNIVQQIWDFGKKFKNEGNLSVSLKGYADEDVKLFAAAQTVPAVTAPVYANGDVTLKVTFDKAIPEGKHIVIAGGFTAWEKAPLEMTSTDRIHYSVKISDMIVGDYEFKVMISKNTSVNWDMAYGKDGEYKAQGNHSVTIEKTSTNIDLFGTTELAVPEIPDEVEVTLTATFAGSMAGKVVVLKGAMIGWSAVEMTSTDNIHYSVKVTVTPGTHEFLLGIGDTVESASTCTVKVGVGGVYGAANASITIAKTDTTVALFTVNVPVAPAA